MEWISIKERYPETAGDYLVSGGGKVWVAEFMFIMNIRGFANGCHNPAIEAWMPFPEPYIQTED